MSETMALLQSTRNELGESNQIVLQPDGDGHVLVLE
jgi:hypothetical protein